MKSFTKFVSKLPFSGKALIRPVIFALYQSIAASERKQNYLNAIFLLTLFILAHAVQVSFAVRMMSFDAPAWVRVISAFYALVNICVCVVQMHICFRATRFYLYAPYPRAARNGRGAPNVKMTIEGMIALVITLSGQIFFFSLYFHYR